MEPTFILPLVFGTAFCVLYGIHGLLRPRWPAHKHFPALETRLLEAREDSHPDARPYSLTLDHINSLGIVTYVMHIKRHDLSLFPPGASCDPFDPSPPNKSSLEGTLTSSDLLLVGERIPVRCTRIIEALFPKDQARAILKSARGEIKFRLRELSHDPSTGDVTFTFHLRAALIKPSSQEREELSPLDVHANFFASLVQRCMAFEPRANEPAVQWVHLFELIEKAEPEQRAVVLAHILDQHDMHPAVSILCQHILQSSLYTEQLVLFRHDAPRFFGAIAPPQLLHFARQYARQSEPGSSPERFADAFGSHLPLSALSDRQLPSIHRVELVRRWLADSEVDRDALHEAIAQMSGRDQLQLRAALEKDSSLSGALSTTEHRGGELSVHDD